MPSRSRRFRREALTVNRQFPYSSVRWFRPIHTWQTIHGLAQSIFSLIYIFQIFPSVFSWSHLKYSSNLKALIWSCHIPVIWTVIVLSTRFDGVLFITLVYLERNSNTLRSRDRPRPTFTGFFLVVEQKNNGSSLVAEVYSYPKLITIIRKFMSMD